MSVLKPIALRPNDGIGIFTASSASYKSSEEMFQNGVKNLEQAGFRVKEGSLTKRRASQGYRSGSPQERAAEFMELIHNPDVRCLMATIGGSNSSSLIPYLDFDAIRKARKVIVGYSDISSLHLSILKYAGLRTFYGPALMCWHAEWPNGDAEGLKWFLDATMQGRPEERLITPPKLWSNHRRKWDNGDWKTIPREMKENTGWKIQNPGEASAEIVVSCLNVLVSAAGTPYWPDLKGKILLIEDMDAPQSRNEKHFRHLQLMGVFDQIAGLIVGKPENYSDEGAPFTYEELLHEVIGERSYPIISNFDCGHTFPSITVPQATQVRIKALAGQAVEFRFLERAVNEEK